MAQGTWDFTSPLGRSGDCVDAQVEAAETLVFAHISFEAASKVVLHVGFPDLGRNHLKRIYLKGDWEHQGARGVGGGHCMLMKQLSRQLGAVHLSAKGLALQSYYWPTVMHASTRGLQACRYYLPSELKI